MIIIIAVETLLNISNFTFNPKRVDNAEYY